MQRLFLGGTVLVFALFYLCIVYDPAWFDRSSCRMTYMRPAYQPLCEVVPGASCPSTPYQTFRYWEGGVDYPDEGPLETPSIVIFLHGHAGAYQQARSIASVLAKRDARCLFFTVDYKEEWSAWDAALLHRQAAYLDALLRYLDAAFRGSKVTLLAHSMGGIVARLLPKDRAYTLHHFITLATPHRAPPLPSNEHMAWLYHHQLVSAQTVATHVLELHSGNLDALIPGDLAFSNLDASGAALLETGADHRAILWCRQIVDYVVEAFLQPILPSPPLQAESTWPKVGTLVETNKTHRWHLSKFTTFAIDPHFSGDVLIGEQRRITREDTVFSLLPGTYPVRIVSGSKAEVPLPINVSYWGTFFSLLRRSPLLLWWLATLWWMTGPLLGVSLTLLVLLAQWTLADQTMPLIWGMPWSITAFMTALPGALLLYYGFFVPLAMLLGGNVAIRPPKWTPWHLFCLVQCLLWLPSEVCMLYQLVQPMWRRAWLPRQIPLVLSLVLYLLPDAIHKIRLLLTDPTALFVLRRCVTAEERIAWVFLLCDLLRCSAAVALPFCASLRPTLPIRVVRMLSVCAALWFGLHQWWLMVWVLLIHL